MLKMEKPLVMYTGCERKNCNNSKVRLHFNCLAPLESEIISGNNFVINTEGKRRGLFGRKIIVAKDKLGDLEQSVSDFHVLWKLRSAGSKYVSIKRVSFSSGYIMRTLDSLIRDSIYPKEDGDSYARMLIKIFGRGISDVNK